MREHGGVSSSSGATAQFAIEWCEAEGVAYTVKSDGKRGYYYVEKTATALKTT